MGRKIDHDSAGLPWDKKEANMKADLAAAGIREGDRIRVTDAYGAEDEVIFRGVEADTGTLLLETLDGKETYQREDYLASIEKQDDAQSSGQVPDYLEYFDAVRKAISEHSGTPEKISVLSFYTKGAQQPMREGVVMWDRRQSGYGYAVYYTSRAGDLTFGTNSLSLEEAERRMADTEEKLLTRTVAQWEPTRWEMHSSIGVGMPELIKSSG